MSEDVGEFEPPVEDELGAHVSAAGGVENAPGRAREILSRNLQLFTKQPNRWAEPVIAPAQAEAFHSARTALGIRTVVSHDSYLINLSSPDGALWKRSFESFRAELERCVALGVDYLVTHPGNATDGDAGEGIRRNAEGLSRALAAVPGETMVLLELTAGSGTSVGGTFGNLRSILDRVDDESRDRVAICFDTCHAHAAGYDLVNDYDTVFGELDETVGLDRLRLFHLNDSVGALGSHRDRHAGIGEGELGIGPFERLMRDERFAQIPKLLETPKGDDPVTKDLENLGRLRAMRN